MSRIRLLAALAATTVAVSLVTAAGAEARSSITMSGSTSIYPLATQLAKGFIKAKGHRATFRILQGGSDIGIADVSHRRVTIGNSSRDPKPGDPGGLVFNKVARDALCVVTNPDNKLPNISQSQVQAIFSGRVKSWSQVPGATVSGPIQLFTRTPASGTQDAFQNIFMGPNLRVAGSATEEKSNGTQAARVGDIPQAIGYASFNFTSGVHAVPYQGVPCSLRNAKSGRYGGTRNFWMVTRGKAHGVVASFLKFVRKSARARRVIARHWVPLR